MGNKKTKPTNPAPPNPPKPTTLPLTSPSSTDPMYPVSTNHPHPQDDLVIMHTAIDEMLAELRRDKAERRSARASKRKAAAKLAEVEVEEEEGELFARLQEMIVRDQYVTGTTNTGNNDSKSPGVLSPPGELSAEVEVVEAGSRGKAKGKGKGKLKVKTGKSKDGSRVEGESPLRSPQEFYPYWI